MKRFVEKPWYLSLDPAYIPCTAVLIPTYNEASLIGKKLEDVNAQQFPKEKLEMIVVDSGSTDGTYDLAKSWAMRNADAKISVIKETHRMGKASALNSALAQTKCDVLVTTDADSLWGPNSLRN